MSPVSPEREEGVSHSAVARPRGGIYFHQDLFCNSYKYDKQQVGGGGGGGGGGGVISKVLKSSSNWENISLEL